MSRPAQNLSISPVLYSTMSILPPPSPASAWKLLLPALLVLAWVPACGSDESTGDCSRVGQVVVECPSDVTLNCVPTIGARVDFAASAFICGGGSVPSTCSLASGSLVDPGTTTVECSARAADGSETSCNFDVVATPAGAPFLRCPEDVTVTCSGPRSAVSVSLPELDETCGAASGSISSNAPQAGFPLGTTVVTFSVNGAEGAGSFCRTSVIVVDTNPPEMSCPATRRLLLARDEPTAPPPPVANDLCDDAVTVGAVPSTLSRGTTDVMFSATNNAGLSTSCSTRFEVLEAFTVPAPRLVAARLNDSQATDFTIGWDASRGRDVTGYRVERAVQESGPYESIRDLDADARTFTDTGLVAPQLWYRIVSLVGQDAGGVSETLRVYSLGQSEYVLTDQSVARVPFRTSLAGLVRYPRNISSGALPVAFLMHGNNGICRLAGSDVDSCDASESHLCELPGTWDTSPNAAGLSYLADTMAARGMIVVSINANAMNCRVGFVEQRAELILAHIREWQLWNTEPLAPFGNLFVGRVDLTQTILFGADRSAEASFRAAEILEQFPLTGVSLRGLFAISPSDIEQLTPPDLPIALLMPACGGVEDPDAAVAAYDRTSLAPGTRQHPRSMVFLEGANHRFFNSEWAIDDGSIALRCEQSDLIPRFSQQAVLETVVGEWVDGLEGTESLFLQSLAPAPASTEQWASTPLRMRTSYLSDATLVDRFDAEGTPIANLLSGTNQYSGFSTTTVCPAATGCGGSFPHRVGALVLGWAASSVPKASFPIANASVSESSILSFRISSRDAAENAGRTAQDFTVRLVDRGGLNADIQVSEMEEVPHLFQARRPYEILQTIRMPVSQFVERTPDLRVDDLVRMELMFNERNPRAGEVAITRIAISR